MSTKLQIETFTSEHTLPLYEESQGQEGPAYLYLDTRDGDVYLKGIHPAYANTWGQDEQSGHVRRWNVPNNLTVEGINQLLSDQYVLTRLDTTMTGAEEYYDGSNYRTKLSEKAEDASKELERHLNDGHYHVLEAWDAAMWLNDARYSDLVTQGESHEDAAVRLQKEAISEGAYCSLTNIENALDVLKQNEED